MGFDKALLDIICCPVTHVPLELMTDGDLQRLNSFIAAKRIKSCADELVTETLQEALVTRDGRMAYPVRDGIPVLLEEQGILLAQLNAA
ncbi:MAG TPA: Trm112 family protein [Gammaproteobacteria bacterium]